MSRATTLTGANRPVVPNRPAAPPAAAGKPAIPAVAARPAVPNAAAAAPAVAANETAPTVEETANSAAPVAETAEGAPAATTGKKRKGGRRKGSGTKSTLVAYPGLFVVDDAGAPVMVDSGEKNADGSAVMVQQRGKLTAIPEDFNPTLHAKLKATDFVDESVFLDFRATSLESLASKMRARADQLRKLGSVEDRARANKLLKMRENMNKLAEQLKSQGIDVEAMLSGSDAAAAGDAA